jgi:hypothetical protein
MVVERPEFLGLTAELSKLDRTKVLKFMKEYKKYKKPRIIPEHSPTDMCVNLLAPYGGKTA